MKKKVPHFLFVPASLKYEPEFAAMQKNDPAHVIFVNDVFIPLFATKNGKPSFNAGDLSKYKHIQIKGSSQGGKSAVMALLFLWLAMHEETDKIQHKYILARPTQSLIRGSQFGDIAQVLLTCKWRGLYFQHGDRQDGTPIITCLTNNLKIIPIGLSDSQKITSIKNVKRIWVEEPISRTGGKMAEISEDDYIELDSRTREKGAQIFMTYNPISKNSWLYKRFFATGPEAKPNEVWKSKMFVHHSTFQDNVWVNAKELDAQYRAYGQNYYRIYALGEWGVIRPDSPWWYNFNADEMIVPHVEIKPHLPIYWRLDFNLDIMATTLAQTWPLGGNRHYKGVFDELKPVEGLNNRIDSIKTHPLFLKYRGNSVFITDSADPRNPINPRLTQVKALKSGLNLMPHQVVKGTKNPAHVDSSTVSNTVLALHHCEFSEKCKGLIADLTETKRKPDGGIDKKHHDPHYGDGDRYFDWWVMKSKTVY